MKTGNSVPAANGRHHGAHVRDDSQLRTIEDLVARLQLVTKQLAFPGRRVPGSTMAANPVPASAVPASSASAASPVSASPVSASPVSASSASARPAPADVESEAS